MSSGSALSSGSGRAFSLGSSEGGGAAFVAPGSTRARKLGVRSRRHDVVRPTAAAALPLVPAQSVLTAPRAASSAAAIAPVAAIARAARTRSPIGCYGAESSCRAEERRAAAKLALMMFAAAMAKAAAMMAETAAAVLEMLAEAVEEAS